MGKKVDAWLKKKQRLPVSDVAEEFVSVADIKHYIHACITKEECSGAF